MFTSLSRFEVLQTMIRRPGLILRSIYFLPVFSINRRLILESGSCELIEIASPKRKYKSVSLAFLHSGAWITAVKPNQLARSEGRS